MPPRHNLFQDVVAIIQHHKSSGTVVRESDPLIDRDTGKKREVDVTVTSTVDGKPFLMSIEATERGRRADILWVEQLIAKHDALQTNQLVLVAGSGFWGPALAKATARGVVTITPEDLPDDEHEFAVIAKLTAPPVTVEPTLTGFTVDVLTPSGTTLVGDAALRADRTRADLQQMALTIFERHFDGFVSAAAEDLTRSHTRKLTVTEPPDDPLVIQARRDHTGELSEVAVHGIQIDVSVDVQLHPEMNMKARLFESTATLAGETTLGGAQARFVATQDDGPIQATLRTRQPGQQEPEDWEYDDEIEIPPASD